MRAVFRELCAAAALILFMLGFATVGGLVVEHNEGGIALAEAAR